MDQPTGNRQLRVYNKNNQYSLYSVDEVIANKLNNWKDWKCSAGVRSLYIDYDGNVLGVIFAQVQSVGGSRVIGQQLAVGSSKLDYFWSNCIGTGGACD